MKIMQIITLSELGGAQSVLANLSNALVENNEVVVIAGDGDGKLWQMLDKKVKQIKMKSLKRTLSPIHDFLTLIAFVKLYIAYKPDIIQLHSSKAGLLGRLAFPKKKIIYTVHGFDSIRVAYRKYLFLEKLLKKRSRKIVAVSQYDEQNLKNEGINQQICCIYNGIYKPDKINIELDISSKYAKKILCIARMSKPKRFDVFLETALLLPQYAFIWVGNKEVVANVPENVFCLGNIANAGAFNEQTDLFVLPTNYEGLPIVIIEAMSFGKPVVASNVGGISEIVKDNENGYTVENNPVIFAEKIKYILENDIIYQQFSKNSLKKYHKNLTVENMVNEYMLIYQEIIKI